VSVVRRILAIGAIAAVLAAGAQLSGRNITTAAPAPSLSHNHAHAMTNVYFLLNWLPNVEFAGLWVAQQKGWFQKAGIKMNFTPWSNGKAPETDVPAHQGATFGFQSGAALAIAKSRGVPDVAVYTDTQKSVFGLTVMAKSHITSLKQLRGKKIGYQSHEFYVPATMMSCVGIPETGWKPVIVSFDTSQLTSGNVDAYLTFVTNEPIALRLAGVKTRTFPAANYCFHFYDDVMFTTSGLIKSNPALVKKVVGIVARGFNWAHTHPIPAAKLTVSHYFGPSGSSAKARANLKQQELELETFHNFSRDSSGRFSGLMKQSYWQDSINTLYKYGEIKTKPSAASMFTNQFNPYR